MRGIILVLATLVMSGCAFTREARYERIVNRDERHERIAKAFKDWWNRDNSSSHRYQDESDEKKAHHQQTIVNTVNSWMGHQLY